MRFLITVQPAWSHINSVLPWARALNSRGHEVLGVTTPSAAPRLRDAGITCLEAGTDWTADGAGSPEALARASASSQVRALLRLAPVAVAEVGHVVASWGPDVVLRDTYDLAGGLLAEVLGVPHVVLGVGLRPSSAWLDGVVGPTVRRACARTGIDADRASHVLRGDLWLSAYPPLLSEVDDPLATERFVRVAADDLVGEPPPVVPSDSVYITLGTVYDRQPDLLRRIVAGVLTAGRPAVVTAGAATPYLRDLASDDVMLLDRTPQSGLLAQVGAVICHGGFNTVLPAVAAGIPTAVLPLGADQPQNAQRLGGLGAVAVLASRSTAQGLPLADPAAVTPNQIADILTSVLSQPSFVIAARRLAADLAALPDLDSALAWLEQLAGGSAA